MTAHWPDALERSRRAGHVTDQPEPRGHVVMDPPVPLSPAWRLEHVEHGDDALARATRLAETGDNGSADTWARIANAHYAAANVRARPVVADGPIRPT